jgi:hypothetical protein
MDFKLENKVYEKCLDFLIWSLCIPEKYWK